MKGVSHRETYKPEQSETRKVIPMQKIIGVDLDVKITDDRTSMNEIFEAAAKIIKEFYGQAVGVILEEYQLA